MKRVRASITAGGAYVFGKFKGNGLLGITTEAEKMLVPAALSLVECIAEPRRKVQGETAGLLVRKRL